MVVGLVKSLRTRVVVLIPTGALCCENAMNRGCIEPSGSSFASGLVLVRKDGSLRVCVEYRGINRKANIQYLGLTTLLTLLVDAKGKSLLH